LPVAGISAPASYGERENKIIVLAGTGTEFPISQICDLGTEVFASLPLFDHFLG
jgi:hypothetical protein